MATAAGGCKSAGKCVTALLHWGKLDKRGVGWIKDVLDEGSPPGSEMILLLPRLTLLYILVVKILV